MKRALAFLVVARCYSRVGFAPKRQHLFPFSGLIRFKPVD